MTNTSEMALNPNKIKTFRWLFYLSLFQLLVCLSIPIIMFPSQVRLIMEALNVLTVGLLFGLFFLGVNIYGILVDKKRRTIYKAIIFFICVWTLWAIITWLYIEHMDYLT